MCPDLSALSSDFYSCGKLYAAYILLEWSSCVSDWMELLFAVTVDKDSNDQMQTRPDFLLNAAKVDFGLAQGKYKLWRHTLIVTQNKPKYSNVSIMS